MTEFLYPFLERSETDLPTVLADVRASTLQKGADTIALRRDIDLEAVAACGEAIRLALERGGRLLAFGNGGSSTDAQDLAEDCRALGWPALALPCGGAEDGLPASIQLAGRRDADALVLAAGRLLEATL